MSNLCSFVWGLVGNQTCQGQLVDSTTALAVQAAGWNPPVNEHTAASLSLQQLPGCVDSLAGALSSSGTNKVSVSNLRQLVVGWSHALLLLLSGQAYVCDASAWQHSCCRDQQGQVASSSPAWQLLQLPTATGQQQQWHLPPPSPARDLASSHKVGQVAAGNEHCLLLTEAGGVWAFGSNKYGQVGSVQELQHRSAQHTSSCRTGQHDLCMEPAILQEQKAGNSAAGQQDAAQQRWQRLLQLRQQQHEQLQAQAQHAQQEQHSTTRAQAEYSSVLHHALTAEPVLVLGPGADGAVCQEPVQQVAAGACHSAAVTAASGRLFCWGWNLHGQCCTGETVNVPQPQLCEHLDGVPLAAVAAGMAHTVCVSWDGAVYACGWNSNGQLGTGECGQLGEGCAQMPAAGKGREVVIQGAVLKSGVGQVQPQQQQQQQQQQELVCVSSLQPVLVEDPELDQEHVVQVACGSRHTVVLAASGAVYAWGWNKYGQCCTSGATGDLLQPRKVVLWQQLSEPGKFCKAVAVHAGRWHSLITAETTG